MSVCPSILKLEIRLSSPPTTFHPVQHSNWQPVKQPSSITWFITHFQQLAAQKRLLMYVVLDFNPRDISLAQARSLHSDLAAERSEERSRAAAGAVIRLGPPSAANQAMLTTKKAIYFDETSSESDNNSRRPSLTLKSTLPQKFNSNNNFSLDGMNFKWLDRTICRANHDS